MGFCITLIVLGAIIGILCSIVDRDSIWFIGFGGTGLFLGMLAALVAIVFGGAISTDEAYDTKTTSLTVLVQEDNRDYYLGCDTKNNNYWYCETSDNTKTLNKTKINNTTILNIDTKTDEPYIVIEECHAENPITRYFLYTNRTKATVYIPKDSVYYQYSVSR